LANNNRDSEKDKPKKRKLYEEPSSSHNNKEYRFFLNKRILGRTAIGTIVILTKKA
jgi:hypothetical protein